MFHPFGLIKTAAPNLSLRAGNAFGPTGSQNSTSIVSLNGGPAYYNSGVSGLGNATEPDYFVQAQFRLGSPSSNRQLGLNWCKEKFNPFNDGFRIEAPTDLEFSYGSLYQIGTSGTGTSFDVDFSVSAGPTFGAPMFATGINRTVNFPSFRFLLGSGAYYTLVGVGASAIMRVDAVYNKKFVFFITGFLHRLQTFSEGTSAGTEPSRIIESAGVIAGVGINFGNKN